MADGSSPQTSAAGTVFGTPGVLALLDPILNPQWWDVVNVGGVVSPGLAEVGEFVKGNEWDQKKGKGSDGATLTYVQRKLAKGKIKFTLWTSAHFVAWSTFYLQWKYDPTKKDVQATEVFHPSLAALGLHAFVTEDITNLVHEGNGRYSLTVSLLEYAPPPADSAVSTPKGSKGDGGKAGPGDPDGPVNPYETKAEALDAETSQMLASGQAP